MGLLKKIFIKRLENSEKRVKKYLFWVNKEKMEQKVLKEKLKLF